MGKGSSLSSPLWFLQDAVYVELAGSHAHKEGTVMPDELVALMGTRQTLDVKMQQSQVSIFKVIMDMCSVLCYKVL